MVRIEVTYLINELPKDLSKHKSAEIEQGYLIDSDDACRIRHKGDEYSFTRKMMAITGDKSVREHVEIPILKEEFDKLWKVVVKSLKKKRYYYDSKMGIDLRIDVFEGKLSGLALAELIFTDENYLRDFQPLPWFGREITAENWASNQFLAGTTFQAVKKIIGGGSK